MLSSSGAAVYSVDVSLASSRASDRMRLTAEDFLLWEVVVAMVCLKRSYRDGMRCSRCNREKAMVVGGRVIQSCEKAVLQSAVIT